MADLNESPSLDDVKLQRELLLAEKERFELERLKKGKGFIAGNWQTILTIAVSTSAAFVSVVQFRSAELRDARAQVVREAETIERFFPHLMKEETKDAALLVLRGFIPHERVIELGTSFRATSALKEIASGQTGAARDSAQKAVATLDNEMGKLVDGIFSPDKSARIEATTRLIRSWSGDSSLVPAVLSRAEKNMQNKSGIINALVVLQNVKLEFLLANRSAVSELISKSSANGDQTKRLGEEVAKRFGDSVPSPSQ